jgi:hypothetical protein
MAAFGVHSPSSRAKKWNSTVDRWRRVHDYSAAEGSDLPVAFGQLLRKHGLRMLGKANPHCAADLYLKRRHFIPKLLYATSS